MADLCQASAVKLHKYRQVWAFATDEMDAGDQRTLLDYAQSGGQLVIYPYLPDREMSQHPCTIFRHALSVKSSRTEIIDSPLIDVFDLKDIKCANPQTIYDEPSLADAEIIARTVRGSPCGFRKRLGRGSVIHLGTWIGFDTEGHKAVYAALLNQSGANLRQAVASTDNLAVRQRFTANNAGVLFVANYYNEEQQGSVKYSHPETGEAIHMPYLGDTMLWPALYGVLTPVCLPVADGINILHSTSDILKIEGNRGELTITLQGDRDLPGEIVFEGLRVNQIRSATQSGESLKTIRDHKRIALTYNHKHKEELTLVIQIMA
jgi:beta-galactosidase